MDNKSVKKQTPVILYITCYPALDAGSIYVHYAQIPYSEVACKFMNWMLRDDNMATVLKID